MPFSCEEAEARADQAAKLMTTVKAGVEHLAEKLQHLKAVCTDDLHWLCGTLYAIASQSHIKAENGCIF